MIIACAELVALPAFAHDLLAKRAREVVVPKDTRYFSVLTAPPSNYCGSETPADPFPAVPESYQRKYNTIAHDFLDSERGAGPVTTEMYAVLDSIIDEAVGRLKPLDTAHKSLSDQKFFAEAALRTMDCILLRHRFVYPGRGLVQLLSDGLAPTLYDVPAELSLLKSQKHNVRRSRFFNGAGPYFVVDCDTASYLYRAVAEVMQYPLYLVEFPGHNFVRWELSAGAYIDFETMDGFVVDDSYYTTNWMIPARFSHAGGVLASMSPLEADAYHDATVAIAWSWQGNIAKMLEFYKSSIQKDPTRDLALNNLAWFYATVPKLELRSDVDAIFYAQSAVNLFPSGDDYDTLACAYAQANQFDDALKAEKQASESGYVPQGSGIEANKALFEKHQACNDQGFGKDPMPFRPHNGLSNQVSTRTLLMLH